MGRGGGEKLKDAVSHNLQRATEKEGLLSTKRYRRPRNRKQRVNGNGQNEDRWGRDVDETIGCG